MTTATSKLESQKVSAIGEGEVKKPGLDPQQSPTTNDHWGVGNPTEIVTFNPDSYPGLHNHPKTMAVMRSECGSYVSLCKLLHAAFRCADRVYVILPWGNYVMFRWNNENKMNYYVFDGCTCNVNHFRHMDLTKGTAGLLFFETLHMAMVYLIGSRERREGIERLQRSIIDEVTHEFGIKKHI